MQRMLISFRIDSDSFYTKFAAGTNDPESDLSAIGYQYFVEHSGLCSLKNK